MTNNETNKYVNKILVATRLQAYLITEQLSTEDSADKRVVILKDLVKLSKYIAFCASKLDSQQHIPHMNASTPTPQRTLQQSTPSQHPPTNGFDKLVHKLLSPSKVPEDRALAVMEPSTRARPIDDSLQEALSSIENWDNVRNYINGEINNSQENHLSVPMRAVDSPPPPPPASPPSPQSSSPTHVPMPPPSSQSLIYFSPGSDDLPPPLMVTTATGRDGEIDNSQKVSPLFYSHGSHALHNEETQTTAYTTAIPPNKLNLRQVFL